ncbi:PIN domain-containing protein [Spectribacter acetivorans]|uniref:PIN domain-containing protein n=1 Tax=Spectribacter acetivorans TaxID=3075603 RepID=UPI0032C227EE
MSAITRAEVLAGCDDMIFEPVSALLESFVFLPMDKPIADQAARLRRETRLKLPDAIRAASALVHGMQLATRNTRDFDPDVFDFVQVPYPS